MSDAARRHAERRALTGLDAIYRQAEALFDGWGCARSGDCCQLAKTGREPYAWRAEWLRVRAALEKQGRAPPPPRTDGACPLLDARGGCSVYADRPLGCRTFYCERGFGSKKVERGQVTALMTKLERVAQALDPDEAQPRPLLHWLRGDVDGA